MIRSNAPLESVIQFPSDRSLREVRDWANRVTSFDYYQNGQLHRIHRPNGTQRKFTYTLAGEIECLAELTADGRVLHVSRFTYDQRGHMAQRQSFPVLPEGVVRTPALAAVMGPDNELKEVNAQPQTHDLRGNLRAGFLPDGITAADYEFDARNRLTSLAGGSSRYEYDVANTRIRITEGTQTTTFSTAPLGGMSQVMVESRPGTVEGSLVERLHVYTPGGQRLYHLDPDLAEGAEPGAMQATYYHYELTGSTVTLTGEAGQETGRVHYAAYGEILSRSGNTDTRFLFCGAYGVQTDSSGLLHMRARYYNPYTCRFISEDPIGFEGGLNWYGYANGNPLNLVDPTGFESQWASDFRAYWSEFVPGAVSGLIETGKMLLNSLGNVATIAENGFDIATSGVAFQATAVTVGNAITSVTESYDSWQQSGGYINASAAGHLAGATWSTTIAAGAAGKLAGSGLNAANATVRAESTALSTYRYSQAGETYIRYESANPAFTKFTGNGGLAPGSYAAPMSDGFIPVADRIGVYNLPSANIPRTNATIFSPPAGTPIIGPRPVIGGTGNEVIFPFGFKP